MKKFLNLIIGLLSLLVAPAFLQAHDQGKFEFKVEKEVLSGLLYGPNALQFVQKKMAVLVKTEIELTTSNMSTASTQGLLFCQYRSDKGVIDLELHAKIDKQQIEVNLPPSQIDAIVYKWEELYASPVSLKGLQPQAKRLTFHEGEGFHYDCSLKRNFEYLLTLNIAYDEEHKKLEDRLADLLAVKKFISSIEKDSHGRVILENNKSGLPPFIFVESLAGGGGLIHLHHPMHDIRFNPNTKAFTYAYSDDVASVAKLPEIKRLLNNVDIRKFVFEKTEPIQVRVDGGDAVGYSFLFFRVNSGGKIQGRIESKKIKIL